MNADELALECIRIITNSRSKLEELEAQFRKSSDAIIGRAFNAVRNLVESHGFVLCDECGGSGVVRRLDGKVLAEFGLPGWDGCSKCGGDKELPGRGFIPPPHCRIGS